MIDIIPFDAATPRRMPTTTDLPLDADPDVEALGAIDEELSDVEDADEPPVVDRPWEKYVKTDADVEADAFFATFTADGDGEECRAASEAADEGQDALGEPKRRRRDQRRSIAESRGRPSRARNPSPPADAEPAATAERPTTIERVGHARRSLARLGRGR